MASTDVALPQSLPTGAIRSRGGDLLVASLLLTYLGAIVAGYFVFASPATMVGGNELSTDRAVFAATNAATLTGFQQSVTTNQYQPMGQWAAFGLTLLGSFLSLSAGGLAAARILRLPVTNCRVVLSVVIVQASAVAIGCLLLVRPGKNIFDAAFQGASAFGNSGLYVGTLPGVQDWRTHLVLLPLSILGSLGIPVLLELFFLRRRPATPHTRGVLLMVPLVYLIGLALLLVTQWTEGPGFAPAGLVSASASSINSRTLGFPFDFAHALPRATQWVLILLMIIGGAPAGTAGGLKVTTVFVLFRGGRNALRGNLVSRTFGIALVWFGIYFLIVAATLLLLLALDPRTPADRLLFLAVSAASNVGLSHDPLSIVGAPLFVLSGTMLLGRFVPLLILWWMAKTTRDADVAVG